MVEEYESVQLALFLSAPPPLGALDYWNLVFGAPPEGYQSQQPGHSQAHGKFSDLIVNLIVQPARLDFLIHAVPPPPPALPPGVISNLDTAINIGVAHAEKVSSHISVMRVAAVIQGNINAHSPEDAAAKVGNQFPGFQLPAGATSANIEVAAPKISAANPRRRLMRLCRWQTVQAQFVQLQIGAAPAQSAPQPRFAAHIYVDVFSEGMETLAPPEAIEALKEVIEEAKSIIDRGPSAFG